MLLRNADDDCRTTLAGVEPLDAVITSSGQSITAAVATDEHGRPSAPVSGGRCHQFGHRFRPIARRHDLNHMEAAGLELLEQRRQRHSGGRVDVVQQ